ncbi:hypothetical protein MTR_6g057580 [Medicago truncatula]|uniref:Uncharacterized protein n=1 Tax=Medicago truncatula TaxID=3880 RepID=G7KME3_MEDTR|nr:hypothetical protein MTR_6g057580 [Medicago truncatula]
MNKLAKLKTRKGGLGKNERPAGLTTLRGNPGKNGIMKRIYFPGGSKTPTGDPGKNGMQNKIERNHAKSIDHRCSIQCIPGTEASSSDDVSSRHSPNLGSPLVPVFPNVVCRVTNSSPRTARTHSLPSIFLSSNQFKSKNSSCLSIYLYPRSSAQFKSKNSLYPSICF